MAEELGDERSYGDALTEIRLGKHLLAFLTKAENIIEDNANSLGVVGGNFAIRFYNGLTVVVITTGPRIGVYYDIIDDEPMHFIMTCEAWYLDNLLDPELEEDYDHEMAAVASALEVEGDIKVYERFLKFAQEQSSVSVRLMR